MANSLTLSVLEISFFLSGAIILGVTIRLFLANRGNATSTTKERKMAGPVDDKWELEYAGEMHLRDNEITVLQDQILKSKETVKTLSKELDELRQQQNRFEIIKEQLEKKIRDGDKKNMLHRIALPGKTAIAARG